MKCAVQASSAYWREVEDKSGGWSKVASQQQRSLLGGRCHCTAKRSEGALIGRGMGALRQVAAEVELEERREGLLAREVARRAQQHLMGGNSAQ